MWLEKEKERSMNRQECPLRTPCGLCSIEKNLCDAICGALENTQESSVKKKSSPNLYEPPSMEVAELMYKKRFGIS